jgi:hypothetical protein
MLTRITCPNCGHISATAASLPCVLICSERGQPFDHQHLN